MATLTSSLTVGERGPILLQDTTLVDHLASFDRERIPERVVSRINPVFDLMSN